MTAGICAKYKNVDGWHIFQADEMPGLYVASRDAKTAYDDVGPSIEALLRLDHGIVCEVRPEMSFDDFLKAKDRRRADDEPAVLQLRDRRFVVSERLAA